MHGSAVLHLSGLLVDGAPLARAGRVGLRGRFLALTPVLLPTAVLSTALLSTALLRASLPAAEAGGIGEGVVVRVERRLFIRRKVVPCRIGSVTRGP